MSNPADSRDLIETQGDVDTDVEAESLLSEARMEASVLSSSPNSSNVASAAELDRCSSPNESSGRSEALSPHLMTAEKAENDKPQPGAFKALEISYYSVLARFNLQRKVSKFLKQRCDRWNALAQKLTVNDEGDLKRSLIQREEELDTLRKEKQALINQIETLIVKAGLTKPTAGPLIDMSSAIVGLSESELSQSTAGMDGLLRTAHHDREVIQARFDKLKADYDDLQRKYDDLQRKYDAERVKTEEMNKQLMERNKKIKELKERVEEKETENDSLKVKLRSNEIEKSKLLGESGEDPEGENESLKDEEVIRLRSELVDVKKTLMEVEEEKDVLNDRLTREHDISEGHRRRVAELEKKERTLNAEALLGRKEKAGVEKRRIAAEQRVVELNRKLCETREMAKWMKTDVAKANRECEAVNERLRVLEGSHVGRRSGEEPNESELKVAVSRLRAIVEQNAALKTVLQQQRQVISKLRCLHVAKSNGNAQTKSRDDSPIAWPPSAAALDVPPDSVSISGRLPAFKCDSMRQRTYSDQLLRKGLPVPLQNRPHSEGDFSKWPKRSDSKGKLAPLARIQGSSSPPNVTKKRPIYENLDNLQKIMGSEKNS